MQKFITRKLSGKEFFGHPSGLFVLFFTETGERFSYYGMRALLMLYMTSYLIADPARAAEIFGYPQVHSLLVSAFGPLTVDELGSQLYGLYTGFVYFTPFFGGLIADRYLGKHRSVYLGGTLMGIGHFLMASEQLFLPALLFIILGYGFFKPNLSTQVGNLYPEGDQRLDSAFSIYYMGVNLGAFLSPFVCGSLGQKWGWHWGFGAAGVGMFVCMFIYWAGNGLIPKTRAAEIKSAKVKRPLTSKEYNAVIALAILCILNIVFWSIYEQQGSTLQLWADRNTDWMFFGWEVPSTWYQSFNPAMIILFTPLLISFWAWQNKRGFEPSSVTKMGIGCILCGCAYIVMILAAQTVPPDQRGSIMWLVGTTFVFTVGELYLSPIGLSLVVQVAPKPIISTMMGMWFMSSFFGNYLTGYIGMYYSRMPKDVFFMMLFGLGVGAGILFFILNKPVAKAIRDVESA